MFDIAEAGYKSWYFPALGLVLAAGSGVLLLLRRSIPGPWTKSAQWGLAFALAWTVFTFGLTYYEYWSLSSARDGGRAKVVEGVVSNFSPMPASGHADERFCVDRSCFEYSDFSVSPGFNNTSSHGGPIREGLPVRITYVGGAILKLEVRR